VSYILDALRKSDQERQRGSAPALRSIHSEFAAPHRSHTHWAILALATAMLGAFTAAGVWFVLDRGAQAVQAPVQAAAETGEPQASATETAVTGDKPAAPVESSQGAVGFTPATDAASGYPAPDGTAADLELLELWQLSEAEQKFLGGLQVSLHVYSPEPAQRTVIINGFRVREGQTLGQDLSLLEIVADGLVLRFQDKRVHLSTVTGW
jgi:general secretion pathway protein B